MRRSCRSACAALVAIAGVCVPAAPALAASPPGDPTRGYELVTPVDKNLGRTLGAWRALADGRVAYGLVNGIDESHSNHLSTTLLGRRTEAGWTRTSLDPLSPPVGVQSKGTTLLAVSADEHRALYQTPLALDPRDQDGSREDLYLVDQETRVATLVTQAVAPPAVDTVGGNVPQFAGADDQLTRIVFTAPVKLHPDVPDGRTDDTVYEWRAGSIEVISLDTTSTLPAQSMDTEKRAAHFSASDGLSASAYEAPDGGAHAVSDDASVVFFKYGGTGPTADRFARLDGATTVAYNRSQRTVAGGTPAGTSAASAFIGGAPDGSFVLFSSNAQLTDGATPGGGIYRYTFATGELRQVTPATAGGANATIDSAHLSADGSHVYFAARSVMAPGATASRRVFYVWSATRGTRFIAQAPITPNPNLRVERVSRDGRYAILSSRVALGSAPAHANVTHLYRYRASDGQLRCASCRADGSSSTAAATVDADPPIDEVRGRGIADDGTMFFTTQDALVPEDTNGVRDAYLHDDAGPRLLSTGKSPYASWYSDNSADGRDVYFTTGEALVGADTDGGTFDLYDARRGGGFAEPLPPAPPSCLGIDCAGPPPGTPVLPSPGTAVAGPSGNVTAASTAPVRKRVRLGSISAAKRAALARGRAIRVPVSVAGGGTVTVKGRAAVGDETKTVASGRRTVRSTASTSVNVTVRLTRTGLQQLRRKGRLRMSLTARLSGLASAARTDLTLKEARR